MNHNVTVALVLAMSAMSNGAMAATPRLSSDCNIPPGFAPSEATPFDLDWCALNDGDNVRELLIDIANRWPGGLYARAPSKSIELESDSTDWSTAAAAPVKRFVFFEDQSATNKLKLRMPPAPTNKYIMWSFRNFDLVKIGGTNLSVTFQGTHPGLAVGVPQVSTSGLLNFVVDAASPGVTPELLDVRANVRMAEDFGFAITSDAHGQVLGGTRNRIKQVNVAGLFWNAPVLILGGVQRLWYDPDNFRVSDPYVRTQGWDGKVALTIDGKKIGCANSETWQRRTSGGGANHVDKLTGGVTQEWGTLGFNIRNPGEIGNSESDPFVIRIKDIGMSGPGTGYPEGVRVKPAGEANFFKGDPAGDMGRAEPFRFLRVEALPSQYGMGVYPHSISTCAPPINNNYASGLSNFMRFEANRGSSTVQTRTSNYNLELKGEFDTPFMIGKELLRGQLLQTAAMPQDSPGDPTPDRSYNHIVRVAEGTTITDTIPLHDTITLTGRGTWTSAAIGPVTVSGSGTVLAAKNNRIVDTTLAGSISIAESSANTVIRNVRFTGSARTILSVGSGSDAYVSSLCAPAGSVIAGQGSVTLDGVPIGLPYTLPATDKCTPVPSAKPAPPEHIAVE